MIPDSWMGSIIHPIFKGGDCSNARDYRLIALLDVEANYYASLILQDLQVWMEQYQLIPRNQMRFWSGSGTTTNLFTLALIMHKTFRTNSTLYTCFVAFKVAFNRVSRELLWKKLTLFGIPPDLLHAIQSLPTDTWLQVKLGDGTKLSHKIPSTLWLKCR